MAIIGGDQGKAGESKGSGRKADDLRLSCLCLLLLVKRFWNPPLLEDGIKILWMNMNFISVPIKRTQLLVYFLYLLI